MGKSPAEAFILKRYHVAIVGLLTVLSHYILGLQNEHLIKQIVTEITHEQMDRVNGAIADSTLSREKDFARKSDVIILADKVGGLQVQLARMEGLLRSSSHKKSDDYWSKNDTMEESLALNAARRR